MESLSKLQKDVENKLDSEVLDFEYWQNILNEIRYKKSKLLIAEIHKYLVNKPKDTVKEQVVEVKKDIKLIREPFEDDMEPIVTREIMVKDAKLRVVDEDLDQEELVQKRRKLQSQKEESWAQNKDKKVADNDSNQKLSKFDVEFMEEAMSNMHADETIMVADSLLELNSLVLPLYQPRDPVYFVRVLSRKENSVAHIYGYKFFVSFEHLIDKSVPPSYRVEPDGDSKTTEVVVFSGGAPYYDIAFRIVKKEWDLDANRGYKSEFSDVGVLQLWFRFKRC